MGYRIQTNTKQHCILANYYINTFLKINDNESQDCNNYMKITFSVSLLHLIHLYFKGYISCSYKHILDSYITITKNHEFGVALLNFANLHSTIQN